MAHYPKFHFVLIRTESVEIIETQDAPILTEKALKMAALLVSCFPTQNLGFSLGNWRFNHLNVVLS